MITPSALLKRAGDVMTEFDVKLLDKRPYGLNRSDGLCAYYSDETITRIIDKYPA